MPSFCRPCNEHLCSLIPALPSTATSCGSVIVDSSSRSCWARARRRAGVCSSPQPRNNLRWIDKCSVVKKAKKKFCKSNALVHFIGHVDLIGGYRSSQSVTRLDINAANEHPTLWSNVLLKKVITFNDKEYADLVVKATSLSTTSGVYLGLLLLYNDILATICVFIATAVFVG